jgi:hypothetical protein
MKSFSQYTQYQESFDLVPQSKKEIGTEARGILTSASIKLAQKLFNDLAGTADIPDPINIERMFQSGKKTGSTTYDGNIKIHDYVWPAALKWAKSERKAEIKGKYFIVGHNPKKMPSGLKVEKGKGTRTAKGKGAKKAGDPAGAQWENLITVAYNSYNSKGKQIKKPVEDAAYAEVSNLWDQNKEMSLKLGRKFHTAVSGEMTQFGKGNGKLSAYWTSYGAGNGTPKTDMYTGSKGTDRISLKKSGGSQGMSPTKEETLAVLNSALDQVGAQEEGLMKSIIDKIDTEFKQIILDGSKTDFLKKKGIFGEMESDEWSAKRDEILDLDGKHKEIQGMLAELSVKDPTFYKTITEYITYEACTGFKKFAEPLPKANIMIEFNPDKGDVITYKLGSSPSKMSSDVKKIASGVKFAVTFKTGQGNPSSSFRAAFTKKGDAKEAGTYVESYEEYSHIPTFKELVYETLAEDNIFSGLLTENYKQLDEFAMLDKAWKSVTKLAGNAKKAFNWLKRVLWTLLDKVTEAFKKIRELGERAWKGMMTFLNLEIDKAHIKTDPKFADFMWKGQ